MELFCYFCNASLAVNDIMLIVLWTLAAINDISHLSEVICFTVFLVNDIYGFINWLKMRKRQENGSEKQQKMPKY